MNDEAIITALMANMGDPSDYILRSNSIEVPKVSQRAVAAFKKKFGLLGQALAIKNMRGFVSRLKGAIDAEKTKRQKENQQEQDRQPPEPQVESQYKGPAGRHVRAQTSFRSSFGPSKSFGGVLDTGGKKKKRTRARSEELMTQLDDIFESLNEELALGAGGSFLAAERGKFLVDDETAIDNHADILKVLVMWLADNRPEVMQSAVAGIGNMVRDGTIFRK